MMSHELPTTTWSFSKIYQDSEGLIPVGYGWRDCRNTPFTEDISRGVDIIMEDGVVIEWINLLAPEHRKHVIAYRFCEERNDEVEGGTPIGLVNGDK